MLVRREARPLSVARDAGGRGRGPAAIRLNAWLIGLLMRVRRDSAAARHPDALMPRLIGASRRRWPGCPRATHFKVVVFGAPWRLMPSHQLRGRQSNSITGAERRRPRRLHAVIRRLSAHGQRDLDRAPASSPTPPHAMLGRRAARCWSVARDAGGRGRGPAASRLRLHPSVGLRTSVGTERPRPTPTLRLPRLPGARRRRWLGWLPVTHLKVVVPA
jgi:hypothetical protein